MDLQGDNKPSRLESRRGRAKIKGTIKMDEPIARRKKCGFKLQRQSEPRMETTLLDKTDTEMRDMLTQLIAQNKEQQDQIKAMKLVMEQVLAQQTTIANKLHATDLLWRVNPKEKIQFLL